jgi:hypothetical protein
MRGMTSGDTTTAMGARGDAGTPPGTAELDARTNRGGGAGCGGSAVAASENQILVTWHLWEDIDYHTFMSHVIPIG